LYFHITKGSGHLLIAVECTWSNYTCELYSSKQSVFIYTPFAKYESMNKSSLNVLHKIFCINSVM